VGRARLRIRQHFVVHEGVLHVLQATAPIPAFANHDADFARFVASFSFLPPAAERAEARRLRGLAARCGSEVPRARTWAEAAERAAREKRLVLVAFEQFRGLAIPPLANTTTFMDEDLVALCRERFVVLPWGDGVGAPFEAPSAYGLGPHTFGQGVLFVTPAGEVLSGLGLLEPSFVEERARAVLARRPEATGSPFDLADAAAALRRGDLDRAAALLAEPTTAEAWRRKAALLRRRRDADGALAALARAAEAGADAAEVAADRGLVHLRAGKLAEAQEALAAAGDLPRARYWLAVARAARLGLPGVRAELAALAGGDPADRWTWRAAALLLGRGPATGMEAIVWPADSVRAAAAEHAFEPTPATEAQHAADEALAYLLRTQRPDGTWPVPMSFAPDPTSPMTLAVTAIAGTALLRRRTYTRSPVDAAVQRARAAVERGRVRLLEHRGGVFDYTVWAQVFTLRFYAALFRDRHPNDPWEELMAPAVELAAALARGRSPGGGWSYANLASSGGPSDNSISFLTAAALLALSDLACQIGPRTPETTSLQPSLEVLRALRRPDGSFAYQTGTPGIGRASEAALRGPLCVLALRPEARAGEPSPAESAQRALEAALPDALAEAGKPLCHTAPDGVSAYSLLFGLRYAAEALAGLPPAARARGRAVLERAVLALRRADGSFSDFPPVGPAYGTAMALETLEILAGHAAQEEIAALHRLLAPPKGTSRADVEAVYGPGRVIEEPSAGKGGSPGDYPMHLYVLLPGTTSEYARVTLYVTYEDGVLRRGGLNFLAVTKGRAGPAPHHELAFENRAVLSDLRAVRDKYGGVLARAPWTR
jgi:hypothetical protein